MSCRLSLAEVYFCPHTSPETMLFSGQAHRSSHAVAPSDQQMGRSEPGLAIRNVIGRLESVLYKPLERISMPEETQVVGVRSLQH